MDKLRILGIDELHKLELNILKSFDDFCRKREIKYSVGAGTMIGTVRHSGFIPWDDDIDIFMKRDEYNKFVDAIKESDNYFDSHYYAKLPGQENYRYPFIKLVDDRTVVYERDTRTQDMGVWVDIFPVDFSARNKEEADSISARQCKIYNQYLEYNKRHKNDSPINMAKNIFLFFYRIKNRGIKEKVFEYARELAENEEMEYSGTLVWAQTLNDIYPTEYFDGYIDKQFEDLTVMIFKNYDLILRHRFGDYMQLPPEEKRVSHNPIAYLKESE